MKRLVRRLRLVVNALLDDEALAALLASRLADDPTTRAIAAARIAEQLRAQRRATAAAQKEASR